MNNPNLLSELREAQKRLGEQPRGIAWGYASIMGQAADEVERLRERLGPHGLEVLEINGAGHYVNKKVKAEVERLREALEEIADLNYHTNPGVMIARLALRQK